MGPDRDLKPEGEQAHQLAEKMTTEPMILAAALAIFGLLVAIYEWEAIWEACVALLGW